MNRAVKRVAEACAIVVVILGGAWYAAVAGWTHAVDPRHHHIE